MMDTGAWKQALKDATDEEALAVYTWATACMEVRGLIPIAGAQPQRKRRSDAGAVRKSGPGQRAMDHIYSAPNAAQPSLSGLPDENEIGQ